MKKYNNPQTQVVELNGNMGILTISGGAPGLMMGSSAIPDGLGAGGAGDAGDAR